MFQSNYLSVKADLSSNVGETVWDSEMAFRQTPMQ